MSKAVRRNDTLHVCPKCKSDLGITFQTISNCTFTAKFLTKEPVLTKNETYSPAMYGTCLNCGAPIKLSLFFSTPANYTKYINRVLKGGE